MNAIVVSVCHERINGASLIHYGKEGMHWGYRNYQPYDEGYIPKHKGIFLGTVFKKKDPYRYLDKANPMEYLTGKRSAYDDVRKASDAGYASKQAISKVFQKQKSKFDAWNKLNNAYSYEEAQRRKQKALQDTRTARDWERKLTEYRKDAARAAMRRGINAENLLDQRSDIKGKLDLERKHKEEGYSRYYSDREKDVIKSLERIAETYAAREALSSRQMFEYESRRYKPKTKTERFRREVDSRLNKTKTYAQEYASVMREMMSTPATKAFDTGKRLKYQKEIEFAREKAMKLKNNQQLIAAIRTSARDIDSDLIKYYSGKTSILPEREIKSKFWDPNFFMYDAD